MVFLHLLSRQLRRIDNHFNGQQRLKGFFQFLKKKIIEQLVLKLPDFNHPFQVECDAGVVAIGDVLSQEDRPIAYFNDKMNDAK